MGVKLNGIRSTIQELRREVTRLEKEGVREVQIGTRVLMECLFNQTPVWEGTAVRNYTVGLGAVRGGAEKTAIGAGDPGPTGTMGAPPAGEPRRGANESAALTEAEAALRGMKKLQNIHISNTAAHFDLVENGSAPTSERARNPGGVSNIAMMNARAQLVNFK